MATAPTTFQTFNTNNIGVSGVKMLVYGKPDAGKTTLIRTASRPYVFSSEGGLLSIRGTNLPYSKVNTVQDIKTLIAWINTPANYVGKYDTICIDSLTDIAYRALARFKITNADGRKAYGEVQDTITELLRVITENDKVNFYITAWEEPVVVNALLNETQLQPSLTGRVLPTLVPHFIDIVARLFIHYDNVIDPATQQYVTTSSRWLQCQATQNALARNRGGVLELFEAPNLQQVFNKYRTT